MKNADKNFEYYMSLPYRVVLEPSPEGGWVTSIPDLPGCLNQGETKEEALSYFVGGGNPEDHGFAIQPWSKVRFENNEVIFNPGGKTAEAMGNYYFTDAKTDKEVKVEFTFGYEKLKHGEVKIFLHHSSLPYNPPEH